MDDPCVQQDHTGKVGVFDRFGRIGEDSHQGPRLAKEDRLFSHGCTRAIHETIDWRVGAGTRRPPSRSGNQILGPGSS